MLDKVRSEFIQNRKKATRYRKESYHWCSCFSALIESRSVVEKGYIMLDLELPGS